VIGSYDERVRANPGSLSASSEGPSGRPRCPQCEAPGRSGDPGLGQSWVPVAGLTRGMGRSRGQVTRPWVVRPRERLTCGSPAGNGAGAGRGSTRTLRITPRVAGKIGKRRRGAATDSDPVSIADERATRAWVGFGAKRPICGSISLRCDPPAGHAPPMAPRDRPPASRSPPARRAGRGSNRA
jgi:hypothetical protein